MDFELDNGQAITLQQAQALVDEWIQTTGRGYFPPVANALLLAEETGEVARVIARLHGPQVTRPGSELNLADELADVLWIAMALANQTGIDLTEAFRQNLRKKQSRDAQRFQ